MKFDILIVDDDKIVCNSLKRILKNNQYITRTANNGPEAIEQVKLSTPDLILLDHRLGDITGMQVLKKVKDMHPDIVVIMITAFGNIALAVEAIKNGAYDFIEKETDPEFVRFVVRKALDTIRLKKEVDELQKEHLANRNLDNIFAESEPMKRALELAKEFAKTDTTILIQGETGTGKSLVAELIHSHSHRFNNRFVNINCGAIPKELIESELFGYEPGAFTGARVKGKLGLIERAHNGIMFFDEIGELPLDLQSKLLQVLERGEFFRIGSVELVKVDVRFIAATNAKLEERVKEKLFRPDLYYRLNVASIHIPPLRERKADILPMAKYFVQKFNQKFRKSVQSFAPPVEAVLQNYHWPGNVRELHNLIERIMILKKTNTIEMCDLQPLGIEGRVETQTEGTCELRVEFGNGENALEKANKSLITQALQLTNHNKSRAAQLLGIPRTTLHFYVDKYGIG